MKKTAFILAFLFTATGPAMALDQDGRTTMGPLARVGYVMMRGAANAAGSPFEISGTLTREYRMHSRLWPLTWTPRFLRNLAIRLTSIVNDIFFSPFVAPFTNDLSPFTEAFDLPEYPWQSN